MTECTLLLCPSNVLTTSPLVLSHNFIEKSAEPDKKCFLSGEKATQLTVFVCLSNVLRRFPLLISHNLILPSKYPDKIVFPSEQTFKHVILPCC